MDISAGNKFEYWEVALNISAIHLVQHYISTHCSCRHPEPEMSPEERDARTIFCMQLSAKIRPRDLEEFFSSVGKVSAIF